MLQVTPRSSDTRTPASLLLREKGRRMRGWPVGPRWTVSTTGAGFPMVTFWVFELSPHATARGPHVFPPSVDTFVTMSFQPWSSQENLRPSAKARRDWEGRARTAGMR
jgi:hypothetical protein